jgi:two-component system chemotaxis response regulator CheY
MSDTERRPILVVDDDEIILQSVELVLADEGYDVVVASNGKEALERVEQRPPCLVLLDMKMPVMDGWAFAAAYRERPAPHAPILVMTASQDTRSRAADIGGDGYLAKPFDVDHLLDLVQRHVPQ